MPDVQRNGPAGDGRRMKEESHMGDLDVRRWILVYVATIVGEDSDSLDIHAPLSRYDFDSLDAVEMAVAFEKTFGRETHPELFLRSDQTIAGLTAVLCKDASGA
jgi:acyl carrier protein